MDRELSRKRLNPDAWALLRRVIPAMCVMTVGMRNDAIRSPSTANTINVLLISLSDDLTRVAGCGIPKSGQRVTPIARKALAAVRSRELLALKVRSQNTGVVIGAERPARHLWRCHKQPCTKIVVRDSFNTKSGEPGGFV